MMLNGKTYQRQPWALPIVANVSGLWPAMTKQPSQRETTDGENRSHKTGQMFGLSLVQAVRLWPTPTATMHKGSSPAALTRKDGQDRSRDRLDHCLQALEGSGALNPEWVEWLMGFPTGHTDLQD
jgi:hypothetical protein